MTFWLNVGVVESCQVTVVSSGASQAMCHENVVGAEVGTVDAFGGVISVTAGAAASAGGADASSAAESNNEGGSRLCLCHRTAATPFRCLIRAKPGLVTSAAAPSRASVCTASQYQG